MTARPGTPTMAHRLAGTRAFINAPKLVAGKMPGSEPPSTAERDNRLGPPRRP